MSAAYCAFQTLQHYPVQLSIFSCLYAIIGLYVTVDLRTRIAVLIALKGSPLGRYGDVTCKMSCDWGCELPGCSGERAQR